jgi:hypothetical protein
MKDRFGQRDGALLELFQWSVTYHQASLHIDLQFSNGAAGAVRVDKAYRYKPLSTSGVKLGILRAISLGETIQVKPAFGDSGRLGRVDVSDQRPCY